MRCLPRTRPPRRTLRGRIPRRIAGFSGRLVRRLDPFSPPSRGNFRVLHRRRLFLAASLGIFDEPLTLSDGTSLSPGDPVCDLHLFNEHMPAIGPDGPGLAWAIQLQRGFRSSLTKLAAAFENDPRFAQAKAIRAETVFVTRRGIGQLQRITDRLHFDMQIPQNLRRSGNACTIWARIFCYGRWSRPSTPGGLRETRNSCASDTGF